MVAPSESIEILKIFVCSSPKEDKKLQQEFMQQLSSLRDDKVRIQEAQNISAGIDYDNEIRKHLKSANIILLLISSDFIVYTNPKNEEEQEGKEYLGLAISRKNEARIIPILLRYCVWENMPFSHLKVLPSDRIPIEGSVNQSKAFADVIKEIQDVIKEIRKADKKSSNKQLEGDSSNFSSQAIMPDVHEITEEQQLSKHRRLIRKIHEWQKPISWKATFFTSLGLTFFVIILRLLGVLQASELSFFDQMMRNQSAGELDQNLLLIEITHKNIEKYAKQEAPKNGTSLADKFIYQLLNKLLEKNPRVIGFDNYRYAKPEGDLTKLINKTQIDKRLIFICKFPDEESNEKNGHDPPSDVPIEQVGLSDFLIDNDGVIRRQIIRMGTPVNEKTTDSTNCKNNSQEFMDSFSFKVAQKYLSKESKDFRDKNGILVSDKTVLQPLDSDTQNGYGLKNVNGYQILLNYRLVRDTNNKLSLLNIARKFTVDQVLEDHVDEQYIKDKIVLIGTPNEGYDSILPTPFSIVKADSQIQGLFIQAQMVSQIVSAALGERYLIKVLQIQYDVLWILCWSLIGAILSQVYKQPQKLFILVGMCLFGLSILYILCWFIFISSIKLWIPLVPAALAFLGSSLAYSLGSNLVILFIRLHFQKNLKNQ